MPPTLQVVAQGRTLGEQNIHTAELSAILAMCQVVSAAIIVSESFYALNKALQFQRRGVPFVDADNRDLLDLLMPCVSSDHVFQKIKSDVGISTLADLLHRYAALGNQLANHAALHACSNLHQQWAASLFAKQLEVQTQRDLLKKV